MVRKKLDDFFRTNFLSISFVGIHVRFNGEEQQGKTFRIDQKRLLIKIPPKTSDDAEFQLEVIRDEYDAVADEDFLRTLYKGIINYIPNISKQQTSVDRIFFNEFFSRSTSAQLW